MTLFAEPKRRRGQGGQKPLRELGVDPVSGKPMVMKDGRFGPYVTDGETNASLRKGDLAETITDERASELLQDRRDRGPAKKRSSKKKAAAKKKAPAKKRAAKKKAGPRRRRRRSRPRLLRATRPTTTDPSGARAGSVSALCSQEDAGRRSNVFARGGVAP